MAINKIRQYGNRTIPTLKDKIPFTSIVDDVTTGGTQKPLSAEAGKLLKSDLNQETASRVQQKLDLVGGASVSNNTLGKLEATVNVAETSLQDNIDTVESNLATIITNEVTRATGIENSVTSSLNAEISNRQAAVSAEQTRAVGEEARIEAKLDAEIAATDGEISVLNGNSEVIGSVAQKILVETTRATGAESTLQANITSEAASRVDGDTALQTGLNVLTSTVASNKSTIETSLANEATTRANADSALSSRVAVIEGGLTAGVMWKESVADLDALDALVEGSVESGWAYYVAAEKDVYVVVNTSAGDRQPAGWSTKSFIKIADFNELSGLVNAEKNRALAAEAANAASISAEVSSRQAAVTSVEDSIAAETSARVNADSILDGRLTSEVATLTASITSIDGAYTAADAVLTSAVNQEIADRITDVNSEEARAISAETALSGRLDTVEGDNSTVGSIAYAVKTESDRAVGIEGSLQTQITSEVSARQTAVTAEADARSAADSALSARVDVFEADNTTPGSIAKAQLDAQSYADLWIPQAKLEGADGSLLVSGDTITLVYAPIPYGVIHGEVIVYAGDNDAEAVAVNVSSIAGTQVTLDVVTSGEFDGKSAKVHYFYVDGSQVGGGQGIAGQDGAGV